MNTMSEMMTAAAGICANKARDELEVALQAASIGKDSNTFTVLRWVRCARLAHRIALGEIVESTDENRSLANQLRSAIKEGFDDCAERSGGDNIWSETAIDWAKAYIELATILP